MGLRVPWVCEHVRDGDDVELVKVLFWQDVVERALSLGDGCLHQQWRHRQGFEVRGMIDSPSAAVVVEVVGRGLEQLFVASGNRLHQPYW